MSITASQARELFLRYAHEQKKKRETVPFFCEKKKGRMYAKLHKSDGYSVRRQKDKDHWYSIPHERYLQDRLNTYGKCSSLPMRVWHGGRWKQVGWVDPLGLYAYCPHCRKFHLIAHHEYVAAISRLERLEEQRRAEELASLTSFQMPRIWIPQVDEMIVGVNAALASSQMSGLSSMIYSATESYAKTAFASFQMSKFDPLDGLIGAKIASFESAKTLAALGSMSSLSSAANSATGALASQALAQMSRMWIPPTSLFEAYASTGKMLKE